MSLLNAGFALTSLHMAAGLSSVAPEERPQWSRASDSLGFRGIPAATELAQRPQLIWGDFAASGLPSVFYNETRVGMSNARAWTEADDAASGQAVLGAAAHTLTLLVRVPTTTTGFSTLCYKGSGLWLCSGVYTVTSADCYFTIFYGGATSTVRSNDGAWHLVTISLTGGVHTMYVDSAAGVVSASAWGPAGSSDKLVIGAPTYYAGECYIAGLWAWAAAKTSGEVAAIHASITATWITGAGREVVLCVGDSNTAAPSVWCGAMATSLATLTGASCDALVVAQSGTKTSDWIPGSALYKSAVDAANSEGATKLALSLGTNDCDAGGPSASTSAANLLAIARGVLRDCLSIRCVIISDPISTHAGYETQMTALRAAILNLIDDSRIILGDTTTYPADGNLHPADSYKTTYGQSIATAIYAATSTNVTKGRIFAGATGTDSVTILDLAPAVPVKNAAVTIASYSAQYRVGSGGTWTGGTWAGSTANPAEGVVSALPTGTTHVRRKATDSLGNINYSDPLAITLVSVGSGGRRITAPRRGRS